MAEWLSNNYPSFFEAITIVASWLKTNYLEVFGTISGLIYLFLEIKENIWLWPLGLVTSSLYVVIFFRAGFYADMGLNIYYVVISLYGWVYWAMGKEKKKGEKLNITKVSGKLVFVLSLVAIALFALMAWVLVNYTDSTVPYGDSFTTALSIVATWMLAHKYLEQWLVWIVVNGVSLGLYVYKGLYPTAFLFVFYTSMAWVGYLAWKGHYEKETLQVKNN